MNDYKIMDPINRFTLKVKPRVFDRTVNAFLFEIYQTDARNKQVGSVAEFFLTEDEFDYILEVYRTQVQTIPVHKLVRTKENKIRSIRLTFDPKNLDVGHLKIDMTNGAVTNGKKTYEPSKHFALSHKQTIILFKQMERHLIAASILNDIKA